MATEVRPKPTKEFGVTFRDPIKDPNQGDPKATVIEVSGCSLFSFGMSYLIIMN